MAIVGMWGLLSQPCFRDLRAALQPGLPLATGSGGEEVRWWLLELRITSCAFLGLAIVASFVVEFRNALSGHASVYLDPEDPPATVIWWNVALLLTGYLARCVLFLLVLGIGIDCANVWSTTGSGTMVFSDGLAPQGWDTASGRLLFMLRDPLATDKIGLGGVWQSETIVLCAALLRLVVITFLVGGFTLTVQTAVRAVPSGRANATP